MKRTLSAVLAASMVAGLLPATACAATTDSYTTANATLIEFSDTAASASGAYDGYEIDGTAVSITGAGTYVFSGSCEDGTITVKKEVTDVTLVLDDLTLSSSSTAPITVNKSAEATLLAASGTTNTVSDSAMANDENAAIKVKTGASLTLGGTGALYVDGNSKNGIKGAAESAITVDDLTLTIEAADDGLSCDDELTVLGGTLTIDAGGDAIKASPDVDDETDPDTVSKGDITVAGGTLTLTAAGDGVQADGDLTVSGGAFAVTAGGGHTTTLTDADASCKGLKSAGTMTLSGGTFDMNTADDAFHGGEVIYVTGGSYDVATGDDAFHADNTLVVGTEGSTSTTTPDIDISACYEGLEGAKIYLYSGNVDLTAEDDGVNAANADYGRSASAFALYLLGGELSINAGGDGLDSNGDIIMTDGVVEINGPANGGNGAIDYEGTFYQTGGTLYAIGMSQMAMAPTASASTQNYVAFGTLSQMGGGFGGMGGGRPTDGTTNENMTPPEGFDSSNMPEDMTPPDGMTGEMTGGKGGMGGGRPTDGTAAEDGAFTRPDRGENGGMGGGMGGFGESTTSSLGIAAGSSLEIKNSAGTTVYSAAALRVADSIVLATDKIEAGETYTLYVDGTEAATATATEGTGDGKVDTSFSLSESGFDASANDDGAFTPGQGGMGQQNGVAGFGDVQSSDWYAAAVQYAVASGLMNGVSTTAFEPNGLMSRAMLATVLYRLSGESYTGDSAPFTDVAADAYYAEAVAWAADKGIVTGTSATTFTPNSNVTREALSTMLYRYAEAQADGSSLSGYSDAAQVSDWAQEALSWCVSNGIVTGTDTTTLSPRGTATRAQAATMLQRFAQL